MNPFVWIPANPKWDNYVKIWTKIPFGRFVGNTVYLTLIVTSVSYTHLAEEVTLKWAIWDQETTQYWGDIKDAYEASHPGVTIEMVDLGSTDYMTVLATELSGSCLLYTSASKAPVSQANRSMTGLVTSGRINCGVSRI